MVSGLTMVPGRTRMRTTVASVWAGMSSMLSSRGKMCIRDRSHDGEELALFDFEIDAAEDPGLSGPGFVTAFDIF